MFFFSLTPKQTNKHTCKIAFTFNHSERETEDRRKETYFSLDLLFKNENKRNNDENFQKKNYFSYSFEKQTSRTCKPIKNNLQSFYFNGVKLEK